MLPPKHLAKIPTSVLRAHLLDKNLALEVYLPPSSGNAPVLYHKNEDGFSTYDLDRIENKGIGSLYIQSDDLHACEVALEERLGTILTDPTLQPAARAIIAHSAGSSVARALTEAPTGSRDFKRMAGVVDTLVDSLLVDPELTSYLLDMAAHERSTASHMMIVSSLAVALGAEVFGADAVDTLHVLGVSGMLHDLGKLSVPSSILSKKGKLTRAELNFLQQHPIESVRLIGNDPNVSARARQTILQHHERIDGQGYPLGIPGDELLPEAKVLTIVDAFHAMIGRRSYRASVTPADANRIMASQAGKQFDRDTLRHWSVLCEQLSLESCNPAIQLSVPPKEQADEVAARHEHHPLSSPPASLDSRPTRHLCKGGSLIKCVHVGRLDAQGGAAVFRALVHDLSRTGLCILTATPIYRGELVNARISTDGPELWVHGEVAWCRQHDQTVYKVGMRFRSKISEDDSHEPKKVHPLMNQDDNNHSENGAEPMSATATTKDEAAQNLTDPLTSQREEALAKLRAISAARLRDTASQRTTVTLAMSGDPDVRLTAAETLCRLNTRMTRDALTALITDQHFSIRERAIVAAGMLTIREAIGPLQEVLRDDDLKLALCAAEALGKMNDDSGLRLAADTLKRRIPEARIAARAVGEITGHRFGAHREGIQAALRYLEAKKLIKR
ncbi:MAG: HD domain-containing phosphohydrolase [Phycisphaerae bacterium]